MKRDFRTSTRQASTPANAAATVFRRSLMASTALMVALSVVAVPALAQTWDGGGANAFWNTGNNWSADAVPANGGAVIIDGAGGANRNPNVNAATNNVASTTISGTVANAPTVTVGSTLNSATVTVSANGTLTISAGGEVRGSSTPTDTALTVSGGTLNNDGTVTGALTVTSGTANNAGVVTGATTISGGTLNLNTSTNLGDAQALTVTGGTVNVDADETVGDLSGTGGILDFTAGNGLTTVTTGTTTFAGAIQGATTTNDPYFVKDGAGSLTLSGANTTTGGGRVQLLDGTLVLQGGNAIGNGNVLETSSGTVDLQANETVGGLLGSAAGTIDLNTNTLTIAGVTGTTAADTSGTITGDGGVTLNATGYTQTFSTGLTYQGATTITAGTFALGADDIIDGASAVTINGGTLAMGTFDNTVASVSLESGSITGTTGVLTSDSTFDVRSGSVSAILGGTDGLTKTTGGTVDLTGANTYTGTTTVSAGTLNVTGAGALASTTVAVNGTSTLSTDADALAAGATVTVASGATFTTAGTDGFTALSSAGTVNGTGALTLSGAFTQTGGTTGGTVNITSDGFTQSGGATIAAGTSVTSSGAQTLSTGTIAGTLNGAGAVTVNTGTTSLTGAGAIINAASIGISSGGTLSSDGDGIGDTLAVTNGGTLTITGNETIGSLAGAGGTTLTGAILTTGGATNTTYSGVASGTGGITKAGTGIFTLSGANTYTGATTVNAGTLDITGSVASGTVTVNTGGTLQVDGSSLANTAAVTLNGTGNLTLTGSETIGSLASASGTSTVTLGANTLTTGGAGDTSFAGVASGTGGITKVGSSTFTLSGTNTYTGTTLVSAGVLNVIGQVAGNVTVDEGELIIGNSNAISGTITTTGSIITYADTVNEASAINLDSDDTQLQVAAGEAATQSGVISEITGPHGIEKIGDGTLTLSGANTYTGLTTVSEGTLNLQGGAAIADTAGVATATGATLGLLSNDTVGFLTGTGGTVDIGATTLTLNGNGIAPPIGETFTYGGVITGSGDVTKTGTDTQELTGANTFTGTLNVGGISGGIAVTGSGSLATTSIATTAGGASLSTDGGALAIGAAITNDGTFALTGGGDESIAEIDGTGSISLSAGSVLTLNAGTSDIDGQVVGSGGLTVAGGTTNLNTVNTYTGTTTVDGGTLNLNIAGGIPSAGAVVVDSGRLEVNTTATIGSLASTNATGGTVDLNANTLTTGGNDTSTTYDGVIEGTGGLTKDGAGDFTIAGTNTYTGTTTVADGTLTLEDGAAIVDAGAVVLTGDGVLDVDTDEIIGSLNGTVNTGLTLDAALTTGGNNASTTMAGDISGTGALTKAGTGTFTLSGTNTNSGDVEVIGGILALSGGAAIANASNVVTTAPGTLQVDTAETIGSLNGSGATTLNATLTTGGNGQTTDVTGVISGAGGLTKAGGGTMTLSANNTYTGATNVDAGTLAVTGAIVSTATVDAGATLDNTGSVATVTNAGTYTADGATTGALTNTGTADITGGTTTSVTNTSGTTDLDGATITGSVTNAAAGTVTSVGATSALSVINSGTFAASGTLDADVTNTASGTFSTTAALNGGGETFINNGTLNVVNGSYTGLASLTNNEVVNVTGQTLSATSGTNTDRIILTNGQIGGAFNNAGGTILFNGASGLSAGSITGGVIDGTNGGTDTDTGDTFSIGAGTTLTSTQNILNVNTTTQTADQLVVTGGGNITGAQSFRFRELSSAVNLNVATVVVVGDTTFDSLSFTVENATGAAPAFGGTVVYALRANGGNLELLQESSAGVGGIAAGVSLTQALIGSVVNRPTSPFASGLAAEEGCSQGGFARGTVGTAQIEGTSTTAASTRGQSVNADYYGVQAGYDFGCNDGRFFGGGWDAAFGALVGYNSGSTDQPVLVNVGLNVDAVASTTLTDFDQRYFGLYAVASKERLTADVQLRFDNTNFELSESVNSGFTGLGLTSRPEFDTDTVTFTARLSYQIPLNDKGLAFVPTGGFSYSHTSGASFAFDNGDRLVLDSFESTVGFIGGTIAKQMVNEDGLSGQAFFGSLNYYNDFAGERTSTFFRGVDADEISSSNIGGFGEASLGWNYVRILENGLAGAKQLNANVRADVRFGGNVTDSYSLTAQVRLSF